MSWLYSQALVAEYSVDICSDGAQSAQSNGNHTQQAYCSPDKTTDYSRLSRYGMTFKPLTVDHGEALLMSYLEDFRAKTLAPLEKAQESKVSEAACGRTWQGSLAKYDPDTHSLKTAQCSLLEDSIESYATLPRWGSMQSGELYLRQIPALHISEKEFGLWLTPRASDIGKGEKQETFLKRLGDRTERCAQSLAAQVNNPKTWPTPTVNGNYNRKGVSKTSGTGLATAIKEKTQEVGQLNPTWVEWLMGWPLGWTDLKPLATDKFHEWQQQHGVIY